MRRATNRTAPRASKSDAVNFSPTSVLLNSHAVHFVEGDHEPRLAAWNEIGWSLADSGPIHGVILVERSRTFGSKLTNLRWNRERLRTGARTLGFTEDTVVSWYDQACRLVLEINQPLLQRQDVSVVVLFSPVEWDGALRWQSTAYLAPIPWEKLLRWYKIGCNLKTSTLGIIPNSTFPSSIKHRSRIHYWLADREAIKSGLGAIGLLVDQVKQIGDCSIANLLIVDHEHHWFTPDRDFAHQGTTLKQSMELLGEVGVNVQSRPVAYEEAIKAKEIILVGSTGVVWSASTLDDTLLPPDRSQCQKLQDLWVNHLGYDFTKPESIHV